MYEYMYIYMHIHIYMYIHIHKCTQIYIYTHICIYIYMYIYKYIYMYMESVTFGTLVYKRITSLFCIQNAVQFGVNGTNQTKEGHEGPCMRRV